MLYLYVRKHPPRMHLNVCTYFALNMSTHVVPRVTVNPITVCGPGEISPMHKHTQLMSRAGTSHSFVAPSFPLLRALMHFSLPGSACQRITVSFGVGVFSSCASVRTLPHCNEMLIFTKYFSSYRMRHMMQSNKSISTNCARSFTYIYIFCSHLVKLWIGIHYDFWVAS